MNILICGGSGQLGSDCANTLQKKHKVIALDLIDLDITNSVKVDKTIHRLMPDLIVNCAAYTNVDACETEKDMAWKVNFEGPKNLAFSAKKYDKRLIHISTDYVFNGKKKLPCSYEEDDKTEPLSFYGKTKLESENVVRNLTDKHVILRISWLYGINGHNFLKTMLKLALHNPEKEIKVVNDQFGSPTWSYRLSLQIEKIIEAGCFGTYHATSDGYCTWYELAICFLKEMGVTHSIMPCTTDEYPTPALRPANSILENRHLKNKGIDIMPHWKDDVVQFVSKYKKCLISEGKEVT